jgi:hypothetical protein
MIDFEKAAFKAFNMNFPRAKTIGCYFHFSQSLWHNFDLKNSYEGELKLWFKRVLALALLTADEVQEMFVELMDSSPELPDKQSSTPFLDY